MSDVKELGPRRDLGQRARNRAAVTKRILEAAREAFVSKGIGDSDLVDIARKAKVGRATLYRYFDGRDALLRGLVQEDWDDQASLFLRLARIPAIDAASVSTWLRLLIRAATARATSFPIFFAAGADALMTERLNAQRQRLMDILSMRFPAFTRPPPGEWVRPERVDALLLLLQIEQFVPHVASAMDPNEIEYGVELLTQRILALEAFPAAIWK